MTFPIAEVYSLTTIDDRTLFFTGEYFLQSINGLGMPPIDYQTRQGYKQQGSSVVAYSLKERAIQLAITTTTNQERSEFWRERSRILDYLRPNRGTDGLGNELTLTIRRADNTKRAIKCRYNGGLEFADNDIQENSFMINEVVRLQAFNPIWYDTAIIDNAPSASVDTDLVFPITFPITFGTEGTVFTTADLTYEGTWRSYPTITIQGPYSTCRLENTGSGAVITLLVPIASTEQRIITLSEEGFSVVDGIGVSKFNELGEGSNLIGFDIRPESELVAGTTQRLKANLVGGVAGASTVTFSYYTRFIGI